MSTQPQIDIHKYEFPFPEPIFHVSSATLIPIIQSDIFLNYIQ